MNARPHRAPVMYTPAQQAVIAHNEGPALVFAVAGAGKTTTMVARIERLVREGRFHPREILATAFNRDAAQAIRRTLEARQISGVQVQTLHGLGFRIVREAARRGLIQPLEPPGGSRLEGLDSKLLHMTLEQAQQHSQLANRLHSLNRDEFLTYVARCKAQLAYADLRQSRLPAGARRIASQAEPPRGSDAYLALFRLYEQVRREAGWLTYDDMVPTAWEVLTRHGDFLHDWQRRYRCLLVDEYQDVNRAQAELVELLAGGHHNLMVIGDDDQTIYTWRGADPRYIRTFARRHRAQVYTLEENFRCPVGPIALANRVIAPSQTRSPKQLHPTQGMGGEITFHRAPDEEAQAVAVARQIMQALQDGQRPRDVAVLVRLFAQAPPIADALRQAGIPCRVEGDAATRRGEPRTDAVLITTIHRAKGLEWPVVLLPGCNDGLLPYTRGGNLEEERRLLYVAITRARHGLHLFARSDLPLSRFLEEAKVDKLLPDIRRLRRALAADLSRWRRAEAEAVAHAVRELGCASYFARWWGAGPEERAQLAQAVLAHARLSPDEARFWQGIVQGRPIAWEGSAARRSQTPRPTFRRTRARAAAWKQALRGFLHALLGKNKGAWRK